MKIQDQNHAAGSSPSAAELHRTQTVSAEMRGYGPSSRREVSLDRVEVSDFADQILNLMDLESKQRAEHVEQLRQTYQAGAYRDSPEAIGKELVAEALRESSSALAL